MEKQVYLTPQVLFKYFPEGTKFNFVSLSAAVPVKEVYRNGSGELVLVFENSKFWDHTVDETDLFTVSAEDAAKYLPKGY